MTEDRLQSRVEVISKNLTDRSKEGESQRDADEGVENEQGLT